MEKGLQKNSTNPIVRLGWRLDKGISNAGAPCSECGARDDVQNTSY